MPNSRNIPGSTWEHARQCLIFYFSRRHGFANAEDLAHDTLVAVWTRADYEFAKDEDFLRVCYGFAAKVLQQGYRDTQDRFAYSSGMEPAAPSGAGSLKGAELVIFLDEVGRLAREGLREGDWDLIEDAVSNEDRGAHAHQPVSNNLRTRLHRARKKLAQLTGWR